MSNYSFNEGSNCGVKGVKAFSKAQVFIKWSCLNDQNCTWGKGKAAVYKIIKIIEISRGS